MKNPKSVDFNIEREFFPEHNHNTTLTTLTIKYTGDLSLDEVFDAIKLHSPWFFEPDVNDGEGLPVMEKAIFNGPATIALWADSTKTVSKARGGDEYDPLFGLLACILRKLTRNRGHAVDEFEGMLREIAGNISSPDDIDGLIDFCMLTLDILTVLRDSSDKWLSQLGEPEGEPDRSELRKAIESIERTQDEVRQMVRNLTMDGELLW